MSEKLVLTVLDTATIFEGLETIFRYDLPGSGVVEGWALAGVIEQATKSSGALWPAVEITVVADTTGTEISDEAVEIIARHLRVAGVAKVNTLGQAPPAARPETTQLIELPPRPRQSALPVRQRSGGGKRGLAGVPRGLVAATVAAVALGGIALAAITYFEASSSPVRAQAAPASASVKPTATTANTDTTTTTAATSTTAADAPPVTIEAAGMSLQLPAGYSWEIQDGMVRASGKDPNMRVLLAADPLYSVPASAVLQEIRAQVEADPQLSQLQEENGTLQYVELPGDGSSIAWTTWVEGDTYVSVGCHSRAEPTVAHKAACRMARETLHTIPTHAS